MLFGNIYIILSLLLFLGLGLGILFRKIYLTDVLAYLFAGIIISLLGFKAPSYFFSGITSVTLAFVGYMVGLTFSYDFLKKMGKKVLIILVVEVLVTSLVVWLFVYLYTGDLPLSILLASLAPATAPAGTIAVFRSMSSHGNLTQIATAIVGLDDAAAIVIYVFGIIWTKDLLGTSVSVTYFILHSLWEIFGAFGVGALLGAFVSYLGKKVQLTPDNLFVIGIGITILGWGIAYSLGVSTILTCMSIGMVIANLNYTTGTNTYRMIDSFMTPIYILFFAAIGMEIDFSLFAATWLLAVIYCLGRTVGKIIGCGFGSYISRAERKIQKYLGVALLNQAGVAVGLASSAAQELSKYGLGGIIITLMAVTTAIFQVASPLGTQYAVKKAGEVPTMAGKS